MWKLLSALTDKGLLTFVLNNVPSYQLQTEEKDLVISILYIKCKTAVYVNCWNWRQVTILATTKGLKTPALHCTVKCSLNITIIRS